MTVLVEARGVSKDFAAGRRAVLRAVSDVDLAIARGETLGIVGESGCGKSTLGRLLLRLTEPSRGSVRFDGIEVTALGTAALRRLRRRMQMVFQDPYSSLDPRYAIGASLEEPFRIQGLRLGARERREKAGELLAMVGLGAELARAYPHQLSGGQRQRVGIARSLALSPDFVVLDEPTASLDVSVQAQIVRLLEDLRARLGLTCALISHNLPLVGYLSDRLLVMYMGRVVEMLPTARSPARHHYTRELMASAFDPDPRRRRLVAPVAGEVPSPFDLPPGCAFATRCPAATSRCQAERPALGALEPGHFLACHHPADPDGSFA